MAKVRLYGDTSGYVDLKAPDVAGDVTITLPNVSGPFATEGYVDAAVAGIPQIAGLGSNVVQTVKTNTQTSNLASGAFIDIAGLSATITPTSDTSRILIVCHVSASGNDVGNGPMLRLVRGSTNILIGDAEGSRSRVTGGSVGSGQGLTSAALIGVDSPNVATATTYKVEIGNTSGATANVFVNRAIADGNVSHIGRYVSTLTLIEVAP